MKKIFKITNLSELLNAFKNELKPVLINLCSKCGNENFLMEQVVKKVQRECDGGLSYQKLAVTSSSIIKQELMKTEKQVLLLIHQGEIKAIFSGMIGRQKLSQALQSLKKSNK